MQLAAGIPHHVLVHILQHVPLTERMSSCSLVQQSWREAAAAATTSITLTDMAPTTASAIARQLVSSSTIWTRHITSISLEQYQVPLGSLKLVLPQLACPKLRQLHLSGFILTATGTTHSSSKDNSFADSRAADSCSAGDSRTAASRGAEDGAAAIVGADCAAAGSMGLLCGCPLLQELSLTRGWVELSDDIPTHPAVTDALSLLTAFTALTRLHLYVTERGSGTHSGPNLGPLLALTGLQELSLEEPNQEQLQGLFSYSTLQRRQQQQNMQLLPSLSKLSIVISVLVNKYSPDATPGLYELSSLRVLDLKGAEVEAVQQLSALSHLESLTLHNASSLRDGHGDPDPDGDSDGYDEHFTPALEYSVVAEDTGELLQLLPQLGRLTHLDLFGLGGSKTAVPQWTCLGRCTGLQVLRLQNLFMHKDSWPLLFSGAQLSRLRELRLIIYSVLVYGEDNYVPMPPQAVQQMVDACPNLEVLQLGGDSILSSDDDNCLPEVRQSPPVSLAPLGQLHRLTSLRVYSERTQAFSDLWRLRQLRHLMVGGRVTDLALVQLSALTNLTSFIRLELENDEREYECWDDSVKHLALSHSQATPVWQQILDHCQQKGWCEAVFQHGQGLQAQVAAQQQQIEEQQQQLEEQKRQLTQKEQQLAEQAAELAALKAYLATQQLPV